MPVYTCLAVSCRTVPYERFTPLPDLLHKRDRQRLAVRREPYWVRLSEGAHLGFRSTEEGLGFWIARYRGRDKKRVYKALGDAALLDFDEAKREAERWIAALGGPAIRTVKRATVRAALEAYLADLVRHGRAEAAKGALGYFKLTVYKDHLAELELERAAREDFEEWRDRLRPGRKPRTINRLVRAVVAGLNRAVELGHVGTPAAWKLKPLTDVEDEGETAIFLSPEQRRAVIAAAGAHAAAFFRGLELTGARPKELAAARVRDFGGEALKLAHKKGRPPKLRVRFVVLSADGVEFFKLAAADKLPAAYIFTEDGKTAWRRHIWAQQMRAAVAEVNREAKGEARIPPRAGAYSFRHARISELLQVHGIDPLTVAHQTGTSIAMIEKAYMRFIPSALREKLAAVRDSAAN